MKIVSMTKYRLHRYFYSSHPAIPLIATLCFFRVMYSVKPMEVCSGYIISGVFQFCLMTFVALGMNRNEETVEEQLLLFHGKRYVIYCMAREVTLLVISCLYGILLIFGPVIQNCIDLCIDHFSFFTRTLTASDVAMAAMIILGSGFAGIAIGDVLHPRIMGDRKMAVTFTVGIMIFSIVKDAVIDKYRFLMSFGILFPSVMKPARDLGNRDYFAIKSVITFLLMMTVYYLIVVVIKNLLLNRKKF